MNDGEWDILMFPPEPIPKVPALVDFASDRIRKSLQAAAKFFVFEGPEEEALCS